MRYEVWLGYQKNKFSSNFGCNNLGGKKSWKVLPCSFLLECYLNEEHFNNCKNFHGKLKACEIMCEKSKSTGFMKAVST